MRENINESMIYGYMLEPIQEGLFDKLKYINNKAKEIEKELNYLKNHKNQITEEKLDEIKKEIDEYKKNVGEKYFRVYEKLYSSLKELRSLLPVQKPPTVTNDINKKTNDPFLKLKDIPIWDYYDDDSQKEVVKYINSKVIPALMTSQYKKELRKIIDDDIAKYPNGYLDKEYDKEYFINKNKTPTVKAIDFERGIIEIIPNETQQLCTLMIPYITTPIADLFDADIGDGDEGCIYL